MKKNIAIVAGGDSSELSVSLKSAAGIESFIDKNRYNTYIVTIVGDAWNAELSDGRKMKIDKNDFSFMLDDRQILFDFAYITIHGTPGENGILQGYFDLIRMPYSTCDLLTSALTFNKFTCNQYLKSFGVRVAESILLRKGDHIADDEVVDKLGLPCFIKPNVGGSSFGITKVKEPSQIQQAIKDAFAEGEEVLIEAFIEGKEFTCGIYKTHDKTVVLPVSEIIPLNEFFDFGAKYNNESEEITPARISAELTGRIQQLTRAIYEILNCKGIVRIDYIITEGDVINLLEVNTTPGMTGASFIPQQVEAAGMSMQDVMTDIIESELN